MRAWRERPVEIVSVKCDRCGKTIDGAQSETGTAGFYNVSNEPWAKYALPGERIICDPCMWSDAGYRADYPQVMSGKKA